MISLKRRRIANYLYTFFIGFLICLLVQVFLQDKFERNFFEHISRNIQISRKIPNGDSSIIDAVHVTNKLLSNRSAAFKEDNLFNYDIYDGSLSNDLLTANGACGSYASVLANLLETMGYKTRIVQMKVNNTYGGHIITEVSTQKGWVVLDPMYDLFFITPAGKLASFADVSGNWEYYKKQTPENYNQAYKYEDLRYANWDKIPILMPAMRKILTVAIGEQRTREVSLRPLFLRKYRFYCILLIPLIIFFVVRLYKNYIAAPPIKRKIFPKPHLLQTPRWTQGASQPKNHILVNILSELGLESIFNYRNSHSRSKDNFYRTFINEVDLQPLLDCRDNNDLNAQKTVNDISIYNIPFNSRIRMLRLRLGWAKYHIKSNNGNFRHDIYFYTIHLYDRHAIAQFHYFDNKYFLCNITFSNADKKEQDSILEILTQKYAMQTGKNDKNITVDTRGNFLLFENSVNLNICYISQNVEIIRILLNNSKSMDSSKLSAYRLSHLSLQNIL